MSTSAKPELEVLCSHAFQHLMHDLVPELRKAADRGLHVAFATSGTILEHLRGGATPDIVIMTRPALETMIGEGFVKADGVLDLATTLVGVAVRPGSPHPDLSSVDAFRQALLTAPSIAYSEPASGGASGVHFLRVLQQLGIVREMEPRTRLVGSGGNVGQFVADGGADVAIQLTSELVPIAGVEFVGPLPDELNSVMRIAAGIGASSPSGEAAASMIRSMAAHHHAPLFHRMGLTPA